MSNNGHIGQIEVSDTGIFINYTFGNRNQVKFNGNNSRTESVIPVPSEKFPAPDGNCSRILVGIL